MVTTETELMPAHWANYLINGDPSGMEDNDITRCDEHIDKIIGFRDASVTVEDDAEPFFSWSFDLHGGNAKGGELLEYTIIVNLNG